MIITCFPNGTTSKVMSLECFPFLIVHNTCSVTIPTFPPWTWVTDKGLSLLWVVSPHHVTMPGLMKLPADPESSITFTQTASLIHTLVKNCLVITYGIATIPISKLSTVDTLAFDLAVITGSPSFLNYLNHYQSPNPCSQSFPFLP